MLARAYLFEGDAHALDIVSVPVGREDAVCEAQDQHVLHHLLAQVVVNAVDLGVGAGVWACVGVCVCGAIA